VGRPPLAWAKLSAAGGLHKDMEEEEGRGRLPLLLASSQLQEEVHFFIGILASFLEIPEYIY